MGIAGSATKPGTTDLFDASALVPEPSSAIPLHIESGVTKELAQTTSSRAADTTPHYAGGQLNAPQRGLQHRLRRPRR